MEHALHNQFVKQSLSTEQVQQFEREGFIRLGRTLTDDGLALMREQCMSAWRAEKGPFDPAKNWLHNALLTNIHRQSTLVRDYYFDGPLVDVMEQLIGPNVKAAASQLTFKLRGNDKPFGWHQDNGYGELDPYTAISCLTALDDADRENGCLWIIPASHKRGQIRVEQTPEQKAAHAEMTIGKEQGADDSEAVAMEMQAGECLIIHGWTLHRSDGNFSADRDRRFLFTRYADADAVEVYNDRKPRVGRLLRGKTVFPEVRDFESTI